MSCNLSLSNVKPEARHNQEKANQLVITCVTLFLCLHVMAFDSCVTLLGHVTSVSDDESL